MTCYDGHSVWVNSKVLALAGITKAHDGSGERRHRHATPNGEPTGHLKESATDLISTRCCRKPTEEDRRAALKAAVAHANQFGVTSIQNAGGTRRRDGALRRGEEAAADLTVRTYLAISATVGISESDADRMDGLWKLSWATTRRCTPASSRSTPTG